MSSVTDPDVNTSNNGPTLAAYLTGFGLALLLTIIPFGVVAFGNLAASTTFAVIAVSAVAQILVHLRFFLHLDMSREQRWNSTFTAFSVLILAILVGGSLWLFFNLHIRMMAG